MVAFVSGSERLAQTGLSILHSKVAQFRYLELLEQKVRQVLTG